MLVCCNTFEKYAVFFKVTLFVGSKTTAWLPTDNFIELGLMAAANEPLRVECRILYGVETQTNITETVC
jgi:hypothetical protein